MKATKLFAVGFQKTGTSSLGRALEMLGYRVGGYWDFRDMAPDSGLTLNKVLARALELTDQYDAFKDTPWPVFYREMDAAYPGSKFIHVVRNTKKWIRSATTDFAAHPNSLHRVIYGCDCPIGNESVWIERYERHNAEVIDYFHDRSEDFITLNLDRNEVGWKPICSLLNHSIPNAPWPHVNRIRDKKRRMFFSRVARKLGIPPK